MNEHEQDQILISRGSFEAILDQRDELREQNGEILKALVKAALPLEVLAMQIKTKPYEELTVDFQDKIVGTVEEIRSVVWKYTKRED